MNLINHLDKDNLHHAYLIEGVKEEVLPEILDFIKSLGVKVSGNPDFYSIHLDSFKIEDARNLRSMAYEKSFSGEKSSNSGKKIFLISANNFLGEAQNTLLKMFEEPINNTHFFVIVPDSGIFLKTLLSRFYIIKAKSNLEDEIKKAEKFLRMNLRDRLDFMKELLMEENEEEDEEIDNMNNGRAKGLKFLNALEYILQEKLKDKNNFLLVKDPMEHILKVRSFMSQPGSSAKNLMESVALIIPYF